MKVSWIRHSLTKRAYWAISSLVLALLMWAVLNGPRLEARAAQETASAAELENHEACQRLNMPFGNKSYPACAPELNEVRRQENDRVEQHMAGLL